MKKIMLDPSPSFKTLILPKYGSSESNNDKIKNNFRYCSSGKSALASILAYLRYSGVLKDKMSTVLVPQWIGYEVYKTMTEYCFPTLKKDSDPKVMIVYHQYGFPQDMERILEYSDSKKIILIEDCAHALDSNYKDNRVGSFGDFSIYSFSKFVYCHALGGVGFKDSEFSHFFQDRFNDSSRAMVSVINAIKLLSMNNNVSWTNKILSVKFTNGLTKMSYSRYGDVLRPSNSSIGLYESKINKEKELRKYIYNNYKLR